jgi:hypothetical protein
MKKIARMCLLLAILTTNLAAIATANEITDWNRPCCCSRIWTAPTHWSSLGLSPSFNPPCLTRSMVSSPATPQFMSSRRHPQERPAAPRPFKPLMPPWSSCFRLNSSHWT